MIGQDISGQTLELLNLSVEFQFGVVWRRSTSRQTHERIKSVSRRVLPRIAVRCPITEVPFADQTGCVSLLLHHFRESHGVVGIQMNR